MSNMNEEFKQVIGLELRGKHAHVDPLRALEGLPAEIAREHPFKGVHSCWEILNHIVFWQDLILKAIRGEEVKWPEPPVEGWEIENKEKHPLAWKQLVTDFERGLKEAENLSQKVELTKPLPSWTTTTAAQALGILATHNSYHFGQLVALRKHLKVWPPPARK